MKRYFSATTFSSLKKTRLLKMPTITAVALALSAPTGAQLYGDYLDRDAHKNNPVNVYFGTVKNDEGDYIDGATIVLQTTLLDFVALSDSVGRFRFELPVDISPDQITPRCSQIGYRNSRVIRRLPRGEALTPVEINCTLLQ